MNKKQRKIKQKRQRAYDQKPARPPQTVGGPGPARAAAAQQAAPRQSIPLWTKTGELFQPVRLYYAIRNARKIRARLAALHCMRQESGDDSRWRWLHAGEALELTFEKRPTGAKSPIELGALILWGAHGLVLDVSSIERALAAMTFFDQQLPRRLAHLSHVGIANQLFDPQHVHAFRFPFCAAADAQAADPVLALFDQVDRLRKRRRAVRNADDAVAAYLRATPAVTFPHVEHLKLRFSRKHLRSIRFLLESRQYVAIQRWKGNAHFTPADYVQALMGAEDPTPAVQASASAHHQNRPPR